MNCLLQALLVCEQIPLVSVRLMVYFIDSSYIEFGQYWLKSHPSLFYTTALSTSIEVATLPAPTQALPEWDFTDAVESFVVFGSENQPEDSATQFNKGLALPRLQCSDDYHFIEIYSFIFLRQTYPRLYLIHSHGHLYSSQSLSTAFYPRLSPASRWFPVSCTSGRENV